MTHAATAATQKDQIARFTLLFILFDREEKTFASSEFER
jgi:hypothetical protein